MDAAVVGLADAIEALREELISAMERGENQVMRFSLEPLELTIQVAVTKKTSGKVGWMVVEAGGGYEKLATQTLTPLWMQEDGTLTNDFAIASPAFEGDVIGARSRRLAAEGD